MQEYYPKIRPILSPYDAGARYCGASNGLFSWGTIVSEPHVFVPREHGPSLPMILSSKVGHYSSEGEIPLIFGGDHSLTFYAHKALYNIWGPINIVVFDAHHDSYPDNALSHYSMFYHIKRLFNTKIYWTGVRKDSNMIDPALIKDDFGFLEPREKVYLSIDFDYFSPEFIRSVMDPVDDNGYHTLERFSYTLNTLKSSIVGVDIVEWQGASMNSSEYNFSKSIFNIIREHIISHAGS